LFQRYAIDVRQLAINNLLIWNVISDNETQVRRLNNSHLLKYFQTIDGRNYAQTSGKIILFQ